MTVSYYNKFILAYDIESLSPNSNKNILYQLLTNSDNDFKPFLISFIKEITPQFYEKLNDGPPKSNEIIDASIALEEHQNLEIEIQNDQNQSSNNEENKAYILTNWKEYKARGLRLMMRTVETKDELSNSIKMLIEYICKLNNFGPNINWFDIEDTIENDFLNMKFH